MSQSPEPSKPPLPLGRKQWHRPHQGRIHFRPVEHPYPLEMVQQALPALEWTDRLRFWTSWQAAKLLFLGQPTSKGAFRGASAARKAANEMCLRRLKDLGLLECLPVFRHTATGTFVRSEVNILTRPGVDLLRRHYEELDQPFTPRWSPKLKDYANQTLDHALAINDVAIAAITAARERGWNVELWQDDQQLASLREQGKVRFGDFTPDGFCLLQVEERLLPCFVEVDRGTERVVGTAANSWTRKMERYVRYLTHGYARDPAFRGLPSPLLLTITTGPERLRNLLSATLAAGGGAGFRFTTREQIEPPHDFLGAIWQAPTINGTRSLTDDIIG